MRLDMRRHRGGVGGVGRVKEGLLAGGRTRIYTRASAWRSRGVQGLVIWPGKSPRRTVYHFGPQNWVWRPSAAGQPGGFPGLDLKTWSGVRCGRTARRVSWFGPQNQGWRPVRPGSQEGLVVWASKLPRRPVSRFGPQNRGWSPMRSGGHDGFGGLASKPSSTRVSRF